MPTLASNIIQIFPAVAITFLTFLILSKIKLNVAELCITVLAMHFAGLLTFHFFVDYDIIGNILFLICLVTVAYWKIRNIYLCMFYALFSMVIAMFSNTIIGIPFLHIMNELHLIGLAVKLIQSEKLRNIITWHYFDGESINDIAEKTFLTVDGVRKGKIDSPQTVEIHLNFIGEFIPPTVEKTKALTPEEQAEQYAIAERRERFRRAYEKRVASGEQKKYYERTKYKVRDKRKAEKATLFNENYTLGTKATAPIVVNQ